MGCADVALFGYCRNNAREGLKYLDFVLPGFVGYFILLDSSFWIVVLYVNSVVLGICHAKMFPDADGCARNARLYVPVCGFFTFR